jgi:hypothetical protein
MTTSTSMRPLPKSSKGWMKEIADAYLNARGVNSWSLVTGMHVPDDNLFHLAPSACLKFRGFKLSGRKLKTATEAALASYIATKDQEPDVMSLPHIAFAFCYLAAHFGLDIVEGAKVEKLMDYVVAHERDLAALILRGVE